MIIIVQHKNDKNQEIQIQTFLYYEVPEACCCGYRTRMIREHVPKYLYFIRDISD